MGNTTTTTGGIDYKSLSESLRSWRSVHKMSDAGASGASGASSLDHPAPLNQGAIPGGTPASLPPQTGGPTGQVAANFFQQADDGTIASVQAGLQGEPVSSAEVDAGVALSGRLAGSRVQQLNQAGGPPSDAAFRGAGAAGGQEAAQQIVSGAKGKKSINELLALLADIAEKLKEQSFQQAQAIDAATEAQANQAASGGGGGGSQPDLTTMQQALQVKFGEYTAMQSTISNITKGVTDLSSLIANNI